MRCVGCFDNLVRMEYSFTAHGFGSSLPGVFNRVVAEVSILLVVWGCSIFLFRWSISHQSILLNIHVFRVKTAGEIYRVLRRGCIL